MKGRARKLGIAARRRLAELPEDDGLIPILGSVGKGRIQWMLAQPEDVHRHFAETMTVHDRRSDYLRWGGNQWGEEWVQRPEFRDQFAERMPLLLSDLTLKAWRAALWAMMRP